MKKLYIASQNRHKLEEIQQVIGKQFQLSSVFDLDQVEELPETGSTLRENALQKARFVAQKFKVDCFADDTGLEIDALNGEPGVYSARYAGEDRNPEANMNLVLEKLKGIDNRVARFKTVIALILDGKEFIFEGSVEGEIIKEKRGTKGFGYDPLFIPQGYTETFAEMNSEIKNSISHRGRAVKKLVEFLEKSEV